MKRPDPARDVPLSRFDERDIQFSRVRLVPGTPEHASYYAMRPENLRIDDEIRALPGLLSSRGALAEPALFASAEGSFFLTEALRGAVDGPVSKERVDLDPLRMTNYLKFLALYYGARTVGVADLRPYHLYSHIGRDFRRYGEPIPFESGFAVAFTVEMDNRMVRPAPNAPTLMESGRQYVEAARIAVQLAAAVRKMGHPARAHIDGNYRLIAPLVARDAGLGEIGRIGLLMTPSLGPRIRLGVITTSLELVPGRSTRDATVLDFCERCRKCADNCPAGAIPSGGRTEIDGARRWRVDGDACFRYWNISGTDCARCMSICPYSHPDSAVHNVVRWGVRHSAIFRRAAVRLDDVFYGRRPAPRPGPPWTRIISRPE
jgi:ferredoxin